MSRFQDVVKEYGLDPVSDFLEDRMKIIDVFNDLAEKHPDKIEQLKARPAAMGWFVGKIMKRTNGELDATFVNEVATNHFTRIQ